MNEVDGGAGGVWRVRPLFPQKKSATHRAFVGVETRGPESFDTVLTKGLIQADFGAIIGLPNAHFVNLFLGDSVRTG